MLCVVPADNDKLAFLIKIEHIDNVESAGTIAGAWRADFFSKNQSENINEQERCQEKSDKRAKQGKQLCEFVSHEKRVSGLFSSSHANLSAFLASAGRR
jgi:hypothetical protein